MKKVLVIIFALLVTFTTKVFAQDFSAYRNYVSVPQQNISQPQVVEIPFPKDMATNDFLVVDDQTGSPQGLQTRALTTDSSRFMVSSNGEYKYALTDTSDSTFVDFPVSENSLENTQSLTYTFEYPTTISGVYLKFASFSQAPDMVEISSIENAQEKILLNNTRYDSPTIRFPEVNVTEVKVVLSYSQPLRLLEANIFEEDANLPDSTLLRFLAKPQQSYTIYFNADRSTNFRPPASGNLFAEPNPLRPSISILQSTNPKYLPSDQDEDGIPDTSDNCRLVSNADQTDSNSNGVGDLCDDTDYDGVINSLDNCTEDANTNQSDVDNDGLGDICDDTESRFTEQYPWLPWTAMGGTAVVITVLVIQMSRSGKLSAAETTTESSAEKF